MGTSILDFTHDSYSDVFYNPAYISNINGLQIYTNLSNLGNAIPISMLGKEMSFLQNSVYPSNLVGFLGRWKFLSGGAFYVTEGYDITTNVLDKNNDTESYYDFWNDTTYSYSGNRKSDYTAGLHFGSRQIIGVGTINLFGLRFGVMAKFKSFKFGYNYEDNYHKEEYESNKLSYNYTRNSTGEFGTDGTFVGLIAGTVIGGENTELSISGGIQPGGASFTSKFFDEYINDPYYYSSDYYQYYDDPNGNFRIEKDDNTSNLNLIGSELFASARLRKKVGESTFTSLFGRVSTALFPINITDENEYLYERDRPNYQVQDWDGTYYTEYGYHWLEKSQSKENGDGSVNFFNIASGLGVEHRFANDALFILGVKGNYVHIGSEINKNSRTRSYTYQNLDNDPQVDDFGYIQTIDYNNPFKLNISANILYLEVPSSIETYLVKKLKFRIGSNQIIPLYGNGDYLTEYDNKPNEITTIYTHGPETGTTVIENESDGNTENSSIEASISSTNFNFSSYHTGLGYDVNENITIDILHYSNLTHLNTWYLSCTINF